MFFFLVLLQHNASRRLLISTQVLADGDPDKAHNLAIHSTRFPNESQPLEDTATYVAGNLRLPSKSSPPFLPIGHIALNSEDINPAIADRARGIYCISAFYISRALQHRGLGGAAIDCIEEMASREPFCAKVLALDAVAKTAYERPELWAAAGVEIPKVCQQFVCEGLREVVVLML